MKILVTGGAGYIGSHTVRALQKAGHTPIVLDNLSRGHVESLPEGVEFINMDIADAGLADVLKAKGIEGVMHFAAHSQVGESMKDPMIYYENNVVVHSVSLNLSVKPVSNILYSPLLPPFMANLKLYRLKKMHV